MFGPLRSFASACVLVTCVPCALAGEAGRGPLARKWWQKGQSGWVYKDDWRGKFLRGARVLRKQIDVPGEVEAAVIQFWTDGGGRLIVNGKAVPPDPNRGPIEDHDLTAYIVRGRNTIELRGAREAVAEGGVVLHDGREVLFATDASWADAGRVEASDVRRGGPRGYMGDYHVGRALAVTKAQRAKFRVNALNLLRRRMGEDFRFGFWRLRDPAEVLTLDGPTAAREQWSAVRALLAEAEPIIREAEGHILAGRIDQALKALPPAEAAGERAWKLYGKLINSLASAAARRQETIRSEPVAPRAHRAFNGSQVNRLGWVCSPEPLDNDPAYWEPDLAPPGAKTLGLAGLWWFRTDPDGTGGLLGAKPVDFPAAGFQPIYAPTKWGWERWGHTRITPGAGVNKPYNGLAWYGRELTIPASWAGRDLVLRLGDRWGNNDWLAVNGTWINPPATDRRGSNTGTFTLPAKQVRFGRPNTLLLRVYNRDNIGGLINPGLRISAAGHEPRDLRSPVGPASVREQTFRTPAGEVTQIVYSSALSPAVVVATSGKAIRLHGWAARGYAEPAFAAFAGAGDITLQRLAEAPTIDPAAMKANWLLLWPDDKVEARPRRLLVVFERRPGALAWTAGPDEPPGLEVRYDRPGARLAVVRPFDAAVGRKLMDAHAETRRFWSRALMRYPVGYAEQVAFDANACRVRLDYEYLALADDWKTPPLPLAPLPMLFSYAMEHHWPGAKAEGPIADLGCRARSGYYPRMDCGTYRAAVGKTHVTCRFDRREPERILRGVGTLGEERRIGKAMVVNLHRWGFNSTRPQIPFHGREWGLSAPDGSPALRGDGVRFLDEMLAWHAERGMTCILNWFWDFGRGGFSEARARQIEAFWEAVAKRYADRPRWAVAYSILNEPAGLPWAVYDPFARRVTAAIRKHDRTHAISIEAGGGWAQPEDLDMTEPTGDENTIYQFHFYGPHKTEFVDNLLYPRYRRSEDRWRSYEGWEERMLSPIRFAIRHGRDVFHGEFGLSHLQADGAAERWLEDVLAIHRKYRIGWNWWHYNGQGTYRTGLVAPDHTNPLLPILTRYARMAPPR